MDERTQSQQAMLNHAYRIMLDSFGGTRLIPGYRWTYRKWWQFWKPKRWMERDPNVKPPETVTFRRPMPFRPEGGY